MELWVPVSCCHVLEWILGAADGQLPRKLSVSHCRACFASLPQFCVCVFVLFGGVFACWLVFLECSVIFFSVCRAAWKCWGKFSCRNPKPKGISCSPEKQFRGASMSASGVCSPSAPRPAVRRAQQHKDSTPPSISSLNVWGFPPKQTTCAQATGTALE